MIRANSSAIQPTLKLLKYFFGNIRIDPQLAYNGTPCWLWTTVPSKGGYGRFKVQGIIGYAHVAACRMFIGAIPEELSCDHLCKRPICANPVHIEFVFLKINILRGDGPAAVNARKTHCVNGHEFTNEYANSRVCRICANTREREQRRSQGAISRNTGLCHKGHALLGNNTIIDSRGRKSCRLCKNARARELAAERRKDRLERTHCRNGHALDDTNTFFTKGRKKCRKCRNNASEQWWANLPQDAPQNERRKQRHRDRYHNRKF